MMRQSGAVLLALGVLLLLRAGAAQRCVGALQCAGDAHGCVCRSDAAAPCDAGLVVRCASAAPHRGSRGAVRGERPLRGVRARRARLRVRRRRVRRRARVPRRPLPPAGALRAEGGGGAGRGGTRTMGGSRVLVFARSSATGRHLRRPALV